MFEKIFGMALEAGVKEVLERTQTAVSYLVGLAVAPPGATDKEIAAIDAKVKEAAAALNATLAGLRVITTAAPTDIRVDIQKNFIAEYADKVAQLGFAQKGCGRPGCKNCGGHSAKDTPPTAGPNGEVLH